MSWRIAPFAFSGSMAFAGRQKGHAVLAQATAALDRSSTARFCNSLFLASPKGSMLACGGGTLCLLEPLTPQSPIAVIWMGSCFVISSGRRRSENKPRFRARALRMKAHRLTRPTTEPTSIYICVVPGGACHGSQCNTSRFPCRRIEARAVQWRFCLCDGSSYRTD